MTNEDFKKDLESGIRDSIDNNKYVQEKMLILLEHRKECKKKGISHASTRYVTKKLKEAFPDKWTPGKTSIDNWLIEMERDNGK